MLLNFCNPDALAVLAQAEEGNPFGLMAFLAFIALIVWWWTRPKGWIIRKWGVTTVTPKK